MAVLYLYARLPSPNFPETCIQDMSFKSEFLSGVKKAKKVANRVALELAQTFEEPELEVKLQINLGEQHTEEGDYNAAIENYEKVLKIAQEREDEEDIIFAYINLGFLYFQTEDYKHSIHYCDEYLKLTPHDGARKASATEILGASYHNLGQYIQGGHTILRTGLGISQTLWGRCRNNSKNQW